MISKMQIILLNSKAKLGIGNPRDAPVASAKCTFVVWALFPLFNIFFISYALFIDFILFYIVLIVDFF